MIPTRWLPDNHRYFKIIIFLFAAISLIEIATNLTIFHYPGNSYYPEGWFRILSLACCIYSGAYLQFGRHHGFTKRVAELIYFYIIMSLILIGCIAIQSTPFEPIDRHILTWSEWMHTDLVAMMHWTTTHPVLNTWMKIVYHYLGKEIIYIPLAMIALGQFERLHEHYFLIILSAFIGYTFYYFFPTIAPASMLDSIHFIDEQRATGLKFYQIHAHIKPTTIEGGMIAFPSFHVIWAWLYTYLIRDFRIAFTLLLIINIAVTLSCVLLGWHYVPDIIASIIVVILAHYIYQKAYSSIST